jgi:membrane protein DedA with SNARE-associated domain
MESWLEQFFTWLPSGQAYYLLIGSIAFLESLVAIGLIVPGSTICVFAGFLALHGQGDIFILVAVSICGAFLGDFASFALGARVGPQIMATGYMQKNLKAFRKAEQFFFEHGGKSVFFGRFFGPVRGFVPFVAGFSRMSPGLFVIIAVVSAILWGLSYPGLGYLAGASWQNVQRWSGRFSLLILAALGIVCLVVVLRRRNRAFRD